VGVGVVGDLDDRKSTGAHRQDGQPYHRSMRQAEAGSERRKRQFRRKRQESVLPMRAPGPYQSRLHSLVTNELRKHETEFTKAQHPSLLLEIELSSDYPAMLLAPPPPPPKRHGLSTPEPLTICATIVTLSSLSRNSADPCSLKSVIIT